VTQRSPSAESPEHNRTRSRLSAPPAYPFFLYEKMGRQAIDHKGSISGEGTKIPHPHNPKKMGIQGDLIPLAELEAEPRGLEGALSVQEELRVGGGIVADDFAYGGEGDRSGQRILDAVHVSAKGGFHF
jgi:hypothetical protein